MPKKPAPDSFAFRIPSLPKEIYLTLNHMAKVENCSQRIVVIAGIVALSHLSQHDAPTLKEVWKQTRELAKG